MKTGITTHILDISTGAPARAVAVELWHEETKLAEAATDADGRAVLLDVAPQSGRYRLRFAVEDYFARTATTAFYPAVSVEFRVPADGAAHYHVPLLLGPFGYSTYRGS